MYKFQVSLARLSSTNHFFQQLITGRFLLNVNFPFDQVRWLYGYDSKRFLFIRHSCNIYFLKTKKNRHSLTNLARPPSLRRNHCCAWPAARYWFSMKEFAFHSITNLIQCLRFPKVAVISSKTNDSELVGPKIRSLKPLLNLQLSMLDLSRWKMATLNLSHLICSPGCKTWLWARLTKLAGGFPASAGSARASLLLPRGSTTASWNSWALDSLASCEVCKFLLTI